MGYVEIQRRLEFALEFARKLEPLCRGGSIPGEHYEWLVKKAQRMQSDLGRFGVVTDYKPAYSRVIYPRHQIVFNSILRLHSGQVHPHDLQQSYNIIVAYIGALEEEKVKAFRRLFNPLYLVASLIGWLLGLPLQMIVWAGLLSPSRYEALGGMVRVIANLATWTATLMTLIQGWGWFSTWVRGLVSQ